MKRIDRYITKMFLINYVILFVVVVGLIVLLDLISNFDEFLQYADRVESSFLGRTVRTLGAMVDFYGPLVFLLFAYLAGLLPVAAGGFTLAAMIRNRELLAMLASGIGMHRIVAPIFVIAFLTTLLMVANQELVLPQFAQKLSRKRADIKYGGFRTFAVQFVPDGSGALFTAARFDPQSEMMHDVAILRRFRLGENRFGQAGERIVAQQATWDATRGGWELTNGFSVPRTVKAAEGEDTFAARRPRPVEFLASDLDPVTLLMRKRSRFRELMSIPQLREMIRKPQVAGSPADLSRLLHSRFSLPVFNILLLAIGLSFFLIREPDNLMAPAITSACLSVGTWAGAYIMLQISPGTLPPAAVAWMPVAINLPIAYYLMDRVET